MPSNTISPPRKKYDTPSEKVGKASGDSDDIKKALVNTIDTFVKEGTNDTFDKKGQKLMWWKKPSIILFQ